MKAKLNGSISRQYWGMTCASPNIDVGRVINAFQKFSTTLVDAQAWSKGETEGAKARGVFEYVFPGAHNVPVYEPLERVEKDGNVVVPLAASMIPDLFQRIRDMELTASNIITASRDLQAVARLYAEQTIDASKTGLMVVIENLEGLQKVLSLSKVDIDTVIDWRNMSVETRTNDAAIKQRATKKGGAAINDIFHALRKQGMVLNADLARLLLSEKQEMPERTRLWIEAFGKEEENAAAIKSIAVLKGMYMSLSKASASKRRQLKAVLKDKDAFTEAKSAIAPAIDAQYDALRNMLRCVLAKYSPVDRIRAALYVTIFKGDDNGVLSDFASQLLEEEFFLFVLKLGAKEGSEELIGKVPHETEDPLRDVYGVEDGDVMEFVAGEAEKDGKYASARSHELCGEFTLRCKGDGRWVATKSLANLVTVPEADPNVIMLMSHVDDGMKVRAEDLAPGTQVVLVNYHETSGLKNTVVLDGVPSFRYRKEKGTIVEKMYAKKTGEILQSFISDVDYDGSRRKTAFVTIRVDGRVTNRDLDQMAPSFRAAVAQKKAERAAKRPTVKFMDIGL